MRERAEELGGTLWIEQDPTGGTQVRAELPCRSLDQTLTMESVAVADTAVIVNA
jgi:signal transduction histidine kinase